MSVPWAKSILSYFTCRTTVGLACFSLSIELEFLSVSVAVAVRACAAVGGVEC